MSYYVYASALYNRMVEKGISSSYDAAYQAILAKKKQGLFVYPKQKQNIRMRFNPEWIDGIIFDLFDSEGKGYWNVAEH